MNKYDYISSCANALIEADATMPANDLVADLNNNGYTTDQGGAFVVGGQGIYKVISAAYHRCKNAERDDDAANIASAFTKPDGTFAWDE